MQLSHKEQGSFHCFLRGILQGISMESLTRDFYYRHCKPLKQQHLCSGYITFLEQMLKNQECVHYACM